MMMMMVKMFIYLRIYLLKKAKFFEKNSFAVVTDENRKWCLGVATKYDLISFLHRRQIL